MSSRRPRGELWVQGARAIETVAAATVPKTAEAWPELLFHRFTGNFLSIGSTDSTVEAERLLDLDPSVYFYVNAPHPHFGQHVTVFAVDDVVDSRYVHVSPFDTGGLALGYIPLKKAAGRNERRLFVQLHSFEHDRYWVPFLTWVRKAFRRFAGYVEARVPGHHFLDEVDLEACTSAQAWFWEARVHKMRTLPATPRIRRVTLGPGDRRRFMEWLSTFGAHDSAEALDIAKRFRRLSEESPDPVKAATMYLLDKGVRR
ncbi:hypothetical protein [Microcella sp.]|uniref:hypothetical protein n=1 Tax=Microcella sp. TaxID=1913979 RepID=UPI003F7101C9